ncbi:disulfide bond formation protein B [Novosphingobium flavum]|uniref:disulfide bond formation protein B n=1 Tax=Novosphingobium aerophilum TaxID=2839843 RepID=UPI00163A5FF7|nr:disulfide bond formation protein B [Novosphingobium aerophilum]MBC2662193.1 disulfide bond formation protein B [Novosphingobium aerophilum]
MLPTGPAALRLARLLALLLPAALLGGAYLSQYGFGLYPCEMCWWQRYPHFAAIVLAGVGFAVPSARWPVGLAALAIAVSGLIGGYHAGVEYHWWEGITHCTSTAAPGGDALQSILDAPLVRCDQAQWTLLGISLAGFNFLFSTGGALALAALLVRSART